LAGEDRAFTEFMRRHKQSIYSFVRRYVGDADEALDLVQETFVAAWSALASFNASWPAYVWLRRIALNKCRDWSRRRRVRRFFFTAKSFDIDSDQAAAIVVEHVGDTEASKLIQLDAAIAALPAPLKEALLLTQFEGLSHKEAGAQLGISAKAIETRVYRARVAITAALGATTDG
jgi:RNA polymerase sigma-70 factor (ECF subfamily)